MDKETQTKPEKRTAIFTKEASHYSIDTVALSKTRLANKISESQGSYTFFWKGKTQDEERIHGIGLAIKPLLLKPLPDLPTTFNEWHATFPTEFFLLYHSHQCIFSNIDQQWWSKRNLLWGSEQHCEVCPLWRYTHTARWYQHESQQTGKVCWEHMVQATWIPMACYSWASVRE